MYCYELGIYRLSSSNEEAEKYCKEGHFAPGSMLPKVQAAIRFVKKRKGREGLICSLSRAKFAIKGEDGTKIK